MPDDDVPDELAEVSVDSRLGWMHLHRPPPSIPRASSALSGLARRLLAKSPNDRFEDAGAVRVVLQGLPEAAGVLSPAVGSERARVDPLLVAELSHSAERPRRGRATPVILAVILLAGGLVFWLSVRGP